MTPPALVPEGGRGSAVDLLEDEDPEGEEARADREQDAAGRQHLGEREAAPRGALDGGDGPLEGAQHADRQEPRGHGDQRDHAAADHGEGHHHAPGGARHRGLGLPQHRDRHHDPGEADGRADHGEREQPSYDRHLFG